MGLVVLAKDVLAGDVAYIRRDEASRLVGLPVERVEVLENSVRLWLPGHATAIMHPYEVLGVERAADD